MYVVLLRFGSNKSRAPEHMAGHQEWITAGIDDGVFVLVGSIRPGLGGAILASGVPREEIEARIAADPFVAQSVVTAEIVDIDPNTTDPRLDFLAR